MPAYFTCPKCHQKNYGQKHVPVANVIRGLRCTRCGLTEISWVAEGFGEAARAQLGPKAQIAVGVHESEIEWLGPDVASPRDQGILKRLEPSASLKAPYSQGERTKNFSPGTQAIKEGICEGQCLHWIRRVLQGGTEDYKPKSEGVSDKELVLKQKRQHTVGAVGQILTAKIVERQKKATSQHAVAKAAENLALRNLQAEKDQASAKFDAALGKLGFVRQGDEWKPKLSEMPKKEWDALQKDFAEAMQKWKQIEEVFAAKARAISAQFITKADAARQSAMALENGLYGDGWQELAKQLDSWIDQKVKVGKRRFNNILSVKNVNRRIYESASDFATAMVQDLDFSPGTCALLSVGLSKGRGESGGSIGGHAIAAHFKDVQGIYLFDPNLGIFECKSKEQFRRTLETMIGSVWAQDLKWEMDGEFGYSLFRTRGEIETNEAERPVRYFPSLQYTATTAKADGATPRAGR